MADETLFAFTETVVFTEDILDFADDETLYTIQTALLENPYLGDVIPGTSGARKGRVSESETKNRQAWRLSIYLRLSGKSRQNLFNFLLQQEGKIRYKKGN